MSDQGTDSLFHKMSRGEQVDPKEIFRFELYRLQSFVTWPRDTNAYPTSLARVGLYYLGNGDTVACFHCNVHLGQWEKIDLPLAEHERHSPNCAFIRGENIGNVPLVVNNQCFSIQLIRQQEDDIRNERAAAQSIGLPTSPGMATGVDSNLLDMLQKEMAELSLKYPFSFAEKHTRPALNITSRVPDTSNIDSQPELSVQGGSTRNMTETQLQTSLSSSGETNNSESIVTGSTRQEQINQAIISIATEPVRQGVTEYCPLDTLKSIMQSANHPAYAHINRRMESYATWPYSHVQNPIKLAEAGFYYTGREDRIRCFLCNGGLCNWENGDIAWYEHCRWFERCRYAIACRADPVIRAIVDTAEQSRQPLGHHGSAGQTHCDEIPDGATTRGTEDTLTSQLEIMGFQRDQIETMLQARGTEDTSIEQAVEILTANVAGTYEETTSSVSSTSVSGPVAGAVAASSSAENPGEEDELKDTEAAKDDETSGKKRKKKNKKKKGKKDGSSPELKDREPAVSASSLSLTEEEQEGSEAAVNKALTSLKTENEALKSRRICKVCMEKEVCIVFLPCSHLVCCLECAMQLSTCPMCRGTIKATVKVFI